MISIKDFNKTAFNLDKTLAVIGLFLAVSVIIASFSVDNPMYAIVGISLLTVCTIYLKIDKSKDFFCILELRSSTSIILLLNISFFLTLCYSILSLYFRSDPYVRPLSYFISIILMVSILSIEILVLPSKRAYHSLLLLKIIVIPVSLVWSQLLIFPTVLGVDPWWHQQFTQDMLAAGFLPEGRGYQKLPIFHLLSGVTSLITGLDYKLATLFSISSMQMICLLSFTFLLGRYAFNAKVGLLAALLLGVSNHTIHWSWWTIPMTFGFIMPIILYLLFKIKQDKPHIGSTLAMVLMVTIILTHPLVGMCMAILLFTLWAGFEVFGRLYKEKHNMTVTLGIATFFSVTMFAWWMYASGHIISIARLLKWGFSVDYWIASTPTPIYESMIQYNHSVPFFEVLFNSIGGYLFFDIALIGSFYMVSKEVKNPYSFNIAVGGMIIVSTAFFAEIFPIDIANYRWHYFSQILLSIPLAVALFFVSMRLKKDVLKTLFVVTIVAALSFLMIMVPFANMDNPIFKDTSMRNALIESELQVFPTILELTDKNIGTDGNSLGYFTYLLQIPCNRTFPLGEALYTKDFADYKDSVIIIRRVISQSSIRVSSVTFTRLDYDPAQLLTEESFSCFYNSGSVSAFC